MEIIPVASSAAKLLLSWLPAFVLRWHYTPDRLSRLVYIDVQPRNQSVYLNLAPAADFRVAMQVINLSPFAIELDRARLELSCGTAPLEATNVERRRIQAGEVAAVYFSQLIPDSHAQQIVMNQGTNSASLTGLFEFNCDVQSFARRVPSLSGLSVCVANAHLRQ
jgi:hypothetical protein